MYKYVDLQNHHEEKCENKKVESKKQERYKYII